MATWNDAFIQTLVSDSTTLKDGEKLARSEVWSGVGCTAEVAWGLAQGSGKSPYQVCLDLEDAASKCSCPSRKFPCKHAVGLMLLLVRGTLPSGAETPTWASDWLAGHRNRREAVKQPKPIDKAAQAKREAARLAKVSAGVDELQRFLEDLARLGLSDPSVKSYAFWDRIAARMVDAQMQPVARRLRALGGLPFQKRADWASLLMEEVGRLYTLAEAYQRLADLPESLAWDIRTALGFSIKQEELLAEGQPIEDRWQIVGVMREQAEKLQERRTWLYGETSQRYALLLDYAHASRPFETLYPLGHSFVAQVVYYPSAYPQRVALKEQKSGFRPLTPDHLAFGESVAQLLDAYADALAQNPLLSYLPVGLQEAWVTRQAVLDTAGYKLPLGGSSSAAWLNAVTGGQTLPVFGEWDGSVFALAALVAADGWTELGDS